MADKKDVPVNFDVLLGQKEITDTETQKQEEVPASPSPDEELRKLVAVQQAQIEELKALLVSANSAPAPVEAPQTAVKASGVGDDGVILIHFKEDGFSAFGEIWHRGQELLITERDYERTRDTLGNSWLDIRDDREAQEDRYGKQMFATGPFVPRKNEVFDDVLVAEDARRGRKVPQYSGD